MTRTARPPIPTPGCSAKGAGKEAKLCHMGHLMTESRNGLIVDARLTEANGTAERATALDMIEDNVKPGSTVGADKNYDTSDFVAGCRERGCTPHVSQNNTNRRSAIDGRTTRHPGYCIRTIKRKRNRSAGSRPSGVCARPGIAVGRWSSGSLFSPQPPTISFAFQRFWRRQDESVRSLENGPKRLPSLCT